MRILKFKVIKHFYNLLILRCSIHFLRLYLLVDVALKMLTTSKYGL